MGRLGERLEGEGECVVVRRDARAQHVTESNQQAAVVGGATEDGVVEIGGGVVAPAAMANSLLLAEFLAVLAPFHLEFTGAIIPENYLQK